MMLYISTTFMCGLISYTFSGTYLKHKLGLRKLIMYTYFEAMCSLLSTKAGSVLPVKALNGSLWSGHPHTSVTWAQEETCFTVNLGAVLYCVTPAYSHRP